MMNLFAKTPYGFAEEDRLTNALMAVLELSDRSVLSEFLTLATGRRIVLEEEEAVGFDLQVAFVGSRPDARIRTREIDIVIESKLGPSLDEDQFRRHWKHLASSGRRTTALLSLTGATTVPAVVGSLNATGAGGLAARHISWNDVLSMCRRLRPEHEPDSGTFLLLTQLEEYLWDLGYYFLQGDLVEHLTDYANALRQVAEHEATTRKQLRGLLLRLASLITGHPALQELVFSVRDRGAGTLVTPQRVHFDFLDAPVPGLSNARLRVLPCLPRDGGVEVQCYLTCSGRGGENEAVLDWLVSHREEIIGEIGPFNRFGDLTRNVFHMHRLLPDPMVAGLLRGDDASIQTAAVTISTFFAAILDWLGRARDGAPGRGTAARDERPS